MVLVVVIRPLVALSLIAPTLAAACLGAPSAPAPPGADAGPAPDPRADPLAFLSSVRVNSGTEAPLNPALVAREPSIEVGPDGTIWIAGPTGFVTPAAAGNPRPYTHDSGLWSSRDGGATWVWNEMIPKYGRDVCPGGGDSDIEISPDGTIFLADLWLGSITMSVSGDGGRTWLCTPVASPVPVVDRQWLAVYRDEAVYLLFNQIPTGAVLLKANRLGVPIDGLVFTEVHRFDSSAYGKIQVDQRDGTLYVPAGGLQVSTDGGRTFERRIGGSLGFSGVAIDEAGIIYLWSRLSLDQGRTWVNVSASMEWAGNFTHPFIWQVAGGRGILSVAWYGKPDVPPASGPGWYLYFAQTTDALGESGPNGTFDVIQVSEGPVLTVEPCSGLFCGPGRELGDFFEVDLDREGRAVIAYNDAANYDSTALLFAKQTAGPAARLPT